MANRYPHQLSGGQKQRALLAVALAGEPDLLIADEPTSSLDTVTKASVLDTLEELADARDLSVLLITHDLSVVERACGRTLVIRAGEIVDSGPTERVLSSPDHEYTQSLVAARRRPARAVDGGTRSSGAVIAELDGATERYGNASLLASLLGTTEPTVAAEECTLAIHEGETVGLLGRSGAGKTTLARMLAGLETATHRETRLDGTAIGSVSSRPPRLRGTVGYVFQSPREVSTRAGPSPRASRNHARVRTGRPATPVPGSNSYSRRSTCRDSTAAIHTNSPVGKPSESPSRGRSRSIPTYWCSTRRRVHWTRLRRTASARCSSDCVGNEISRCSS
jgi:ABC-type microcin C transport system duplicated ATPase subunit YejF